MRHGGARMPAATVAMAPRRDGLRRHRGAKRPLPVQSAQAYLARFPPRSCVLWANERKTGDLQPMPMLPAPVLATALLSLG
jgi:hypothetical protein